MSADPHQVIVMMYDGLLESIAQAKGAIERKDLNTKAKMMTKAVNILTALQNALDKDSQPEISKNFDVFYGHCIQILNEVNITLEIKGLDDVHSFIKPLRDAWKDIPLEDKEKGLEMLREKNSAQNAAVGA
jgi:flagellar protein FliS